MDNSKKTKQYWRKQIKRRGVAALGGKCLACQGVFEDCCYDFHHLNPEEKEFEISAGNTNGAKTWLKVRDELKKCALLCANCHRLYHAGFIELDTSKNYFIEDYYDWDLCDKRAINTSTGEPIEKDEQLNVCPTCGGWKSYRSNECMACSGIHSKQYEISREELKELIYTIPFTKIGERFGVSDNAIRKRCKSLGLPSKKSEIKQYSREEWDKI